MHAHNPYPTSTACYQVEHCQPPPTKAAIAAKMKNMRKAKSENRSAGSGSSSVPMHVLPACALWAALAAVHVTQAANALDLVEQWDGVPLVDSEAPATVWAAPDGVDSPGCGTHVGNPCASLAYAVAVASPAGNSLLTVIMAAGNYTSSR